MRLALLNLLLWANTYTSLTNANVIPDHGEKRLTAFTKRYAAPIVVPVPKPVPITRPNVPTIPKPNVPPPKPLPKPITEPGPKSDPTCKRAGTCQPLTTDQEALRSKGEDSQKDLDTIHSASPPPQDKNPSPISQNYQEKKTLDEVPYWHDSDAEFLSKIPNGPVYQESGWVSDQVLPLGAREINGLAPKAILDTSSNVNMKTILIRDSNNKELDPTPALNWSDMVMAHWKANAGPENAKNLAFMVRENIRVKENAAKTDTKNIIDMTVMRAGAGGADVNSVQTFRRTSTGDEQINYQLIAGTSHGDRVLKMLGDYHVLMGNLNINAFHVYKPGMKGGPNEGKEYSIIIEFGR